MAVAALPDRLIPRPARQWAQARFARWAIYGQNGRGKTTLIGSIPADRGPWLVVSSDRENVGPLKGKDHLMVVKPEDWEDLDDILRIAREGAKAGKLAGMVFDTWTRWQAHAFNHILGYTAVDPNNDEQIAAFMLAGPKLPKNYDQWQQGGTLLAHWLDFFTALPLHTIFLCQEETLQPRLEQDILITQPLLRREAVNRLFESLSMVGRLYVELDDGKSGAISLDDVSDGVHRAINPNATEVRRLLIGYHPRYRTKGDTETLGYVVTEPTWEKLAATLHTERN